MGAYQGFCTCRDTDCPMHPSRHDQGCSPCIRKNLREGEIPSCFFNRVGSASELTSFHFEDFAAYVLRRQSGENGERPTE